MFLTTLTLIPEVRPIEATRTYPSRVTNGFVGSAASTYYPLFTVRNSLTHQHGAVTPRANQSVVYPISISCSHDDTTPVQFYLIRNATLVGTPNFAAYGAESCIDIDIAATTCTANVDDILFTYALGQYGGGAYAFEDNLHLQPGETYTLASTAVTGTAPYVIASLNFREDQ